MGCIISVCKREKENESNVLLINNYRCFICNKTFPNNNEYNKHIPHCNIVSLNNKK